MKRISFLLGLLLTVMLSVSAQQQITSVTSGDSYDFEGGTAGAWFGWGGQFDGIKVEAPGYKSEYCMLLKPKAKSSNAWEAQAAFAWAGDVDPNVEYTLRFMAKGKGKLQMFYQNGEGGNQQYKSWFEFTDDWEEYTETLKLPADIKRVLFSFATADEVYIDNVEFGVKVDGVQIDNLFKGDNFNFDGATLGDWKKGGGDPNSFSAFEIGKPGAVLSDYCFHMVSTGDQNWKSQPYIVLDEPLDAETTYYLRYWAKGSGKIQSCFQEKDDYNSQKYGANNDLTEAWKCFYEEVTPALLNGAPGKYQKLLFQVGGATVDLDNVEFGPLYVYKPKTKELISGNDSDFEGGNKGNWFVNNNSNGSVGVASPGQTGAYCAEFTKTGGSAAWDFQPAYLFEETLDPSKVYHLEFWAKGSGSFGICYQHASWDNSQDSDWQSHALTDTWTLHQYDYTPSDGKFQKLLFNCGTISDVMYIDNVRFWTEPDPDFKIKKAGEFNYTDTLDYLICTPNFSMTSTIEGLDAAAVKTAIGCEMKDAVVYDYDLKGDSILWEVEPQGWYDAKGAPIAKGAESPLYIKLGNNGAYTTTIKRDVAEEGTSYKATQCLVNTKTGAYYCVNFTIADVKREVLDITVAGSEDVTYDDICFQISTDEPQTRKLDVTAGLAAIGCSANEAVIYTYFDPQKKWVADPVVRYDGAFDRDGLSISKDAKLYSHDVKLDPVKGTVTFGFNQDYLEDFPTSKTFPAVIALVNPATGAAYKYNFTFGVADNYIKGETPLTSDMFFTWDSYAKGSNIVGIFPDEVYCINEKAEAVAHAYGDPNFHCTNYAELDEYGTLHTFFNAGTPVFYFNREDGDASYLRLSQNGWQIVDANGIVNKVKTDMLISEKPGEDYLKEIAPGHWAVSLKSIRMALGGYAHLHAIEGYKDEAVNDPYISKGFVRIYKAVLTPDIEDLPAKETRKHNTELADAQDAAYQAYLDFADEDTYKAAKAAYDKSVKSADFYEPYVKALGNTNNRFDLVAVGLDAQGQAVWNAADNAEFKEMYDNGTIPEGTSATAKNKVKEFTAAVKAAQVAQNTPGSSLYFFGSKDKADWKSDQVKGSSTLTPSNMTLATPVPNPYLPDAPDRSSNQKIKQFVNVKGQSSEFLSATPQTLYQTITGLTPNGEYDVQLYVKALNNISGTGFAPTTDGAGIVQLFTNTETQDIDVYPTDADGNQITLGATDLVTIRGWADMDGNLTFGVQNVADGANWIYAQYTDLILVKLHSDFPDGRYYLKVADMPENEYAWFGGANAWGTQASLIEHGYPVDLESVGHNICTINSFVFNNNNPSTTKHYLGTNGYLDSDMAPWTFTNNGDGTWSLSCAEGNLVEGGNGDGGYPTLLVNNDTPVKWELVSYEQRLADLTTYASPAIPKDATFIIDAPNFSRFHFKNGDKTSSVWTVDASNYNIMGGDNKNMCAESWQSAFTVSQTATAIPNGIYRVYAQAALTDYTGAYDGVDYPVVFANDETTPFCNMEGDDIASSMSKLSEAFTAGKYEVKPIWVVVTDNTLKVGVKGTRTNTWAIWDNIEIEYYGPMVDEGRFDPLCEIIATAHLDIDAQSTTGANEIIKAKLDYNDVKACIGGDFTSLYALNATEGLTLSEFQWSAFTGAYNLKGESVDVRSEEKAYIYVDYNKSNPDYVAVRTLVDPADIPADKDFKVHTYFIIYRAAATPAEKAKAVLVDVQINFAEPEGQDATAIDVVKAATADGQAYDLTGRKVNTMTKGGLYIVNGKKVLVK